jgi:hypothetical protein
MKKAIDADPLIKLIFLCSPGNPTGTLISLSSMRAILDYENFKGIVVVDEAYIDFSKENTSAVSLVAEYANLCVMQTLSKSFGLAAIRYVLFNRIVVDLILFLLVLVWPLRSHPLSSYYQTQRHHTIYLRHLPTLPLQLSHRLQSKACVKR